MRQSDGILRGSIHEWQDLSWSLWFEKTCERFFEHCQRALGEQGEPLEHAVGNVHPEAARAANPAAAVARKAARHTTADEDA